MGEGKKRILLVEDEAIIAMREAHDLAKRGYEVEQALSGEQAIALVEIPGARIDLVLMDINLGRGIDGTAAAREILSRHDIPILFLSSHTETDVVERTEQISSYGYVVKSSGITVLDASIKMAFKLHSANRAIIGANEELCRTQAGMYDVIERISDGFVAFDREFDYVYVNRRGAELLGKPAEELVGRNYWEEYPEARGTPFAEAYLKALEIQQPIFLEEYYADWDRWFSNRIYPSDDGLTIFFTDVTDRKREMDRITRSELQFRALSEDSSIGAYVVQNDAILYVNPVLAGLLGYEPRELIGRNPQELVLAEDRAKTRSHLAKRLSGDTEGLWYGFAVVRKDGTPIRVEAQAAVVEIDGKKAIVGNILAGASFVV